jgi:GxxExxY protein
MVIDEDTDRVIALCFKVHKLLGAGFPEKVYENALMLELGRAGVNARQQVPISVNYNGATIGEYFADILVNERVVCELASRCPGTTRCNWSTTLRPPASTWAC